LGPLNIRKPVPGLLGIVSKNGLEESQFDSMVTPLLHQNRYRVDKLVKEQIAFGRVHLGIYNPWPQPSISSDGTVSAFLDGKIFGKEKEIEKLLDSGHRFDPSNDAEFCLSLFQEMGERFVERLNGNFTVLIHDQSTGRTLLANDRFGFRLHYYSLIGDTLLFAPEPKSILSYPGFAKKLDEDALVQFFSIGEFWQGRTWFQGIRMLPPASILMYNGDKMLIERYWRLTYSPDRSRTEKEFVDDLVKTFRKAVDIRIQDGLRHAVTLSGGLDSRSIAAAIEPEKRRNVIACTFGRQESDEARIAAEAARKLGMKKHLVLDSSPEVIIENAEFDVNLTDGRLYIGLAFVYPIFDRIASEADVIFDGFALDLTLGGSYLTKEKLGAKRKADLLPILARKRRFTDAQLEELFTADFYAGIKNRPAELFAQEFQDVLSDEVGNASDEFAMNGHVAWMHIGDVAVRANVEVSHPSSDNELFDLITRIPSEWRYGHRIYRKFLKQLSPEAASIPYDRTMVRADAPLFMWKLGQKYNRAKEFAKKRIQILSGNKGIMKNKRSYVAFNEWFRTNPEWQAYFEKILLEEDSVSSKYINNAYVQKILVEQEKGLHDHSLNLLYIATFKLLMKTHFGGGSGRL
jgi:asparagine synthase (glutamine-hydrolysing)